MDVTLRKKVMPVPVWSAFVFAHYSCKFVRYSLQLSPTSLRKFLKLPDLLCDKMTHGKHPEEVNESTSRMV